MASGGGGGEWGEGLLAADGVNVGSCEVQLETVSGKRAEPGIVVEVAHRESWSDGTDAGLERSELLETPFPQALYTKSEKLTRLW